MEETNNLEIDQAQNVNQFEAAMSNKIQITFINVSIRAVKDKLADKFLIDNISGTVLPGEQLAIMGPSGMII